MELADLPVEIIITIIRKLDLVSQRNLYYTCKWIQNIICMHGVVKQCNMSRNVMATDYIFLGEFFRDISCGLLELNMSGVPSIRKSVFIPAIRKLKHLKVLDISHTNINILNLVDIHKVCPTLKDVTINFLFAETRVDHDMLMECQSVFGHLENVHFIGSVINLFCFKLSYFLVATAKLHHFKYTVTERQPPVYNVVDENFLKHVKRPAFNQFIIYLSQHGKTSPNIIMNSDQFPVLSMLEFEKHECVIILMKEYDSKIYATPMFNDFFKEKFNITVIGIPHSNIKLFGNVAIMLWNKINTNFGEYFYYSLSKHIKQFFPYYFQLDSEMHESPAPTKYDWFYSIPMTHVCEKVASATVGIKRRRLAPPNLVLNYDVIFKEKQKVELSLDFRYPLKNPIELPAACQYLRKLTYLSLVGLGRHTSNFFDVLFRCCNNLITLNVDLSVTPTVPHIARSLALSQSLKNLRLIDKRIAFKPLFSSFTKCRTLENIHIVDQTLTETNDLANPDLVVKMCDQLYSVYLEARITDSIRRKTVKLFSEAKAKYKRYHINFSLKLYVDSNQSYWDPFADVFKLNPL